MTVPGTPNASDAGFARAKLPVLVALGLVTVGLAIAGTVDRTVGGVLVVSAWGLGVVALHRLGRAGTLGQVGAHAPSLREPPQPPST